MKFVRWKGYRYIVIGNWSFGWHFSYRMPPENSIKGWW